jgi:acyl carrier protein
MDTKAQIHAFLQKLLEDKGDQQPFADDDSMLLSGRLQSIDAVEIVVFLEENFAIDFADIGFDQEQLDSVDAICSLIQTTTSGN